MNQETKEELLLYIDSYKNAKLLDLQSMRDAFSVAKSNIFEKEIINLEKKLIQSKSDSSYAEVFFYIVLAVFVEEVLIAAIVARFVASLFRLTNVTKSIIKSGNTSILKNLDIKKMVAIPEDFMTKSNTYKLMTKSTENIIQKGISTLEDEDYKQEDLAFYGKKNNQTGDTLMKFVEEKILEFLLVQEDIIYSNVKYLKLRTLKNSENHFTQEEAENLISLLKQDSQKTIYTTQSAEYHSPKSLLTNYFEIILYLAHINLSKNLKLKDADTLEGYTQSQALSPAVVSEIEKIYLSRKDPKVLTKENLNDWNFLREKAMNVLGLSSENNVLANSASKGAEKGRPELKTLYLDHNKLAAMRILDFASDLDLKVYNFLIEIENSLDNKSFNLY